MAVEEGNDRSRSWRWHRKKKKEVKAKEEIDGSRRELWQMEMMTIEEGSDGRRRR